MTTSAAPLNTQNELTSLKNFMKTNHKEMGFFDAILALAQDGELFDGDFTVSSAFPNMETFETQKVDFCFKLYIKAVALGKDPKAYSAELGLANLDPIKVIAESQDEPTVEPSAEEAGLLGDMYSHWRLMLAVESAKASDLYDREMAIKYLVDSQDEDGGWASSSWGPDPDTSAGNAITLSRFKSHEGVAEALEKYFDYVKNVVQFENGSIGGFGESSSSTFYTICALIDNDKDVFGTEYKALANNITLFKRDDGSYRMGHEDSEYDSDYEQFSTNQALPALTAIKYEKSPFAELLDNGKFAEQEKARQALNNNNNNNNQNNQNAAGPTVLTNSTSGISIKANAGVIPEGAALETAAVTSGANFTLAETALKSDHEKFTLFDINLLKDGAKVNPNGKVTVSIPVPEGYTASACKIYRIESDGKKTDMDAKLENGFLVFETDHFSLYAVAQVKPVPETGDASNFSHYTFMALALGALMLTGLGKKRKNAAKGSF